MASTIKLNKNQQIELKGLRACGENGTYWPVKDADKFEKLGVIQVARNITNNEGEVAVRISDAGAAYLSELEAGLNNTDENNSNKGVDEGAASAQNANHNDAGNDATVKETKKTTGVKPMFAIESNVAMPTTSRAGAAVYPFDLLEVGQSFFVPATEDKPKPHVSLASTVASANKRYAVEIEGTRTDRKGNVVPATRQERKFVVKGVPATDTTPAGARVWRVEVKGE